MCVCVCVCLCLLKDKEAVRWSALCACVFHKYVEAVRQSAVSLCVGVCVCVYVCVHTTRVMLHTQ